MNSISDLRPSPIAGIWYQGNPDALARQVDEWIQAAHSPALKGDVVGVVAPHAGHLYSGPTAAYAFRSVLGLQPDLVAVISPMHHHHPDLLLTSAHGQYATPLGPVPIDRQAVDTLDRALRESLDRGLTPVANDQEHSLEIELPFLQRALAGSFQLLPVMVRSLTARMAQVLGLALARVLKDRSGFLVASTDLSHFYPISTARQLDAEMLRQIGNFSPEGVLNAEREGTGFACGAGAVAAVLWATKELGGSAVEVLHYGTSADQTGDDRSVVGYGAAVILKQE